MATFSTMYNYIDKYIQKNSSKEFEKNYNKTIRAFLYMNLSNRRDADEGLYEYASELFKNNKEFHNLAVGCMWNMKRVYGDQQEKDFFENIYKEMTQNKSANLDSDYAQIFRKSDDMEL